MRGPSTFIGILVLMKHYTSIAGKLESNNRILQNLQRMDYYLCDAEVPYIRISRYRTMVNLTAQIMNILLQELMSIQNIQ